MKINAFKIFNVILIVFVCLSLVLINTSHAQDDGNGFDNSSAYQALSASQLDTLLAPIALYPDSLLIQVLQAAAFPTQISDAAAWLRTNSDNTQLQQQYWNPSVIAVAYYPKIINSMYQQTDWTNSIGQAFANQSSDVLASVQRLRSQAQAQGNLVSTTQQTVINSGSSIEIVPANSSIIYLPEYDPSVVYYQPATNYVTPLIGFGAGLAIGASMNDYYSSGVNWNNNSVIYRGNSVNYNNGSAQGYYGAGARGYGQGVTAQGTGVYGNQYNKAAVAGGTWNGGSYSGTATTNQWQNGAKTGSYNASGAGPLGSASARGWGYQNGDNSAGGFSKVVTTDNGIYKVSGDGVSNGSNSAGSFTASGVNKEGDYGTKTWSGNNGDYSNSGHSGNIFSGSQNGSWSNDFSNRGTSSRYGGGGYSGSSFGGGGFSGGGFGGGGFRGGGGRR